MMVNQCCSYYLPGADLRVAWLDKLLVTVVSTSLSTDGNLDNSNK